MELLNELRALAVRVEANKTVVQTEEATKNSMIMPFIKALGYDVFNPAEVTPELVADIGTKKGEKVDYAIVKDGAPIIIFECKKAGEPLSANHAGQLFRYFHSTAAKFAVLTNGLVYQFFSDLEEKNKMDQRPFLEFKILDFEDREVVELEKFAKSSFDVDLILATANELKCTRAIKNTLAELLVTPSDDFIKLLVADLVSNKRFTSSVKEQYAPMVTKAYQLLIGEKINERLKGAMVSEAVAIPAQIAPTQPTDSNSEEDGEDVIETTESEYEGFHIVKAIVREVVAAGRIFMKDAQSYCAILLDNNNRRPICRLRFNNENRLVLGLFNGKEEVKEVIESVDDIYKFAEQLKSTALSYIKE